MSRHKAFSFHGVPNIGRSQWHAQADDGTHVFSVWEDNMSCDYAEAHIHNHSVDAFEVGTEVRVVVQRGVEDAEKQSMITQKADPNFGRWVIEGQETRAIDHPRRDFLHVLKSRRVDSRKG